MNSVPCRLCEKTPTRKVRARIKPWRLECFDLCRACEPKLAELVKELREVQK